MNAKGGSAGKSPGALDLEQAMLDPSSVFSSPEEVLGHSALSREQKIEILRRWEYDESEIAVAEEEGMPDGRPLMLRRILLALTELVGDIDTDRRPPTKQGGV
jgi:hypothetical protein